MVPPASHRVSRVPWYSGSYLKSSRLKYWAVTICGGAFQLSSSTIPLRYDMSATPAKKTSLVWPVPRSLAATYGIECFFLFLRVLRCFSSPGSPRMTMYSSYDT